MQNAPQAVVTGPAFSEEMVLDHDNASNSTFNAVGDRHIFGGKQTFIRKWVQDMATDELGFRPTRYRVTITPIN